MDFLRYDNLKSASLLMATAIFLAACQKTGDPGRLQPPGSREFVSPSHDQQTDGGGGIDGSGGNTVQSSLETVKAAVAEELKSLPARLQTMLGKCRSWDDFSYDYQFGQGAKKIIQGFFKSCQSHESALITNLKSGNINIAPQMEACQVKTEEHGGRASGNFEKANICISYKKLQLIPPQVLNEEIFKLLIHELSHLSGFDEEQAVQIQRLVTVHRDLYAGLDEVGFATSVQSCDRRKIEQESKEMEKSPYWIERKQELQDLLSGTQPRDCEGKGNSPRDRVDIFTDDAEFLTVTPKFIRQGFRWDPVDNSQGKYKTYIQPNWVQEITSVASIRLATPTALVWNLDARIGTDAQCSPKILLANLLAHVPDVLRVGCSSLHIQVNSLEQIKLRIAKEKEILSGSK